MTTRLGASPSMATTSEPVAAAPAVGTPQSIGPLIGHADEMA